uniref:Putative secreted protein n=1 Tax=Ixodes ricinus TaxID=34613 RepID=A0A6B0UGB1_IXORI
MPCTLEQALVCLLSFRCGFAHARLCQVSVHVQRGKKKKKHDEWRIGRCVRHRDFEGCGGQARALPRRGFFAPVVLSLRYVEGRGGNAQNHFRVVFFFFPGGAQSP